MTAYFPSLSLIVMIMTSITEWLGDIRLEEENCD